MTENSQNPIALFLLTQHEIGQSEDSHRDTSKTCTEHNKQQTQKANSNKAQKSKHTVFSLLGFLCQIQKSFAFLNQFVFAQILKASFWSRTWSGFHYG